jgi:hypothetical protein
MGLNILYVCFAVFILFVYSHKNEFEHWDEIDFIEKIFPVLSVIGSIVFGIFSLLLLFGAFD